MFCFVNTLHLSEMLQCAGLAWRLAYGYLSRRMLIVLMPIHKTITQIELLLIWGRNSEACIIASSYATPTFACGPHD